MSRRTERGITTRSVMRMGPGSSATLARREPDDVVVEEPLEIRIAGEPLSLTMRTPGQDRELTVGFLFAEGVIESIDDVGAVVHCGRPGEEGFGNVIDVTPGPGVRFDPDRVLPSRRGTLTTAACGVCGRRSIDDLLARCTRLGEAPAVPFEVLAGSTERLRGAQQNFARTGAIHAAAVLDIEGSVLAVAEDVGRHNAVDKVLGQLLFERRIGAGAAPGSVPDPASKSGGGPHLLVVSGRTSFEIMQKATVARLPVLAGVSAPSSLAIDLADRVGIGLAGFVRDGRVNLYTHADRVRGVPLTTP